MVWKGARRSLLIITFGGTLLVLGKLVFPGSPSQPYTSVSTFPTIAPLPNWQSLDTEPLSNPPGRRYRYKQQSQELSIELRYMVGRDPNEKLFRQYNSVLTPLNKSAFTIRKADGVGYYGLSADQEKAYLRACISPHGESVITAEQFTRNHYTAGLQPMQVWRWLIGQEYLRDYRCLWVHFSISLQRNSPDQIYPALENAWITWHGWWSPRFQNFNASKDVMTDVSGQY